MFHLKKIVCCVIDFKDFIFWVGFNEWGKYDKRLNTQEFNFIYKPWEKSKKVSVFVSVILKWQQEFEKKSSKLFLFDITSEMLCIFYLFLKRNHKLIFVITGNLARWSSLLYFQELENKWLVAFNPSKQNTKIFTNPKYHLHNHTFIFSRFFENPSCH